MKKLGILGTTTLAGALLFTGVNSNADAAEISKSDATNSVQNFVEGNPNYNLDPSSQFIDNTESDQPVSNAYKIGFGETQNQSPTWLYVKKDTGEIVDANGNVVQGSTDNNPEQQTTANNKQESNNQQTNQTEQQQSNQQQTSESTDASQSQATELPETGSEETNSTAITTIFATILLAVGSLLTFKRLSKSNK